MRILLTGTNGQLGQRLQQTLGGTHELLCPKRETLDLSRPETITDYVVSLRPDLIINPAAYTAVDLAEKESQLAQRINADAPAAFAQAAKLLKIGLIHYSTDYVFDGSLQLGQAYCEDATTHPINVYGASKFAGEQAISESACQHLILRTSWVYSLVGKNFLLTMLRLARERDELRIVNDQWGAPTSTMLLADATANIVNQIGDASWWQQQQGIYHLTSTGHTSWHGFTEAIVELAHARGILDKCPQVLGIPATAYPTPARRPVNSCLNTSSVQNHFQLELPDWKIALAACLDEYTLA